MCRLILRLICIGADCRCICEQPSVRHHLSAFLNRNHRVCFVTYVTRYLSSITFSPFSTLVMAQCPHAYPRCTCADASMSPPRAHRCTPHMYAFAVSAPLRLSIPQYRPLQPSSHGSSSCALRHNRSAHAVTASASSPNYQQSYTASSSPHPLFAAAAATAAALAVTLLRVRPTHSCVPEAPTEHTQSAQSAQSSQSSQSSQSGRGSALSSPLVLTPAVEHVPRLAAKASAAVSASVHAPVSHIQATTATRASSGAGAGLADWAATRRRLVLPALRAPTLRVRPTTFGLVGVGAVTSGSVLVRRRQRRARPSPTAASPIALRDVCTVVCMQIPFCVSDRALLLERLDRLGGSESCGDAGGMARACRAVAAVMLSEGGLLEDSRRFAPHVEVFLAESLDEAERRFAAHVSIESARLERLNVVAGSPTQEGDYGVVTMVVATSEHVDLRCHEEKMTKLQILTTALDSVSSLREGEATGLELLCVPQNIGGRGLTRGQMADVFPTLKIA